MPVIPVEKWRGLVVKFHERQQTQVTGTLDFARQFALAAGAVPGLATGLDLACFADEAIQSVDILIIKAATFGAVVAAGTPATTTTAHAAFIITVATFTIRTIATTTTTKTAAAAAKSTRAATAKSTAPETTGTAAAKSTAATATFVVIHFINLFMP
jgi:hypothetical protein